MGKKSKRSRGKNAPTKPATTAPALRSPREETKDNLIFEDPFPDEFEEEDVEELRDDEEPDGLVQFQALNPYLPTKEPLEMDPAAYKMHIALKGEWPSLSFDFVHDTWGNGRTRFPHQMIAVVGTQADKAKNNSLQVWKLSDLGKLQKDDADDDDDDVEFDKEQDSDSEEEVDYDPVLEHTMIQHDGGINRVRTHKGVVATWSEKGKVNVYEIDVEGLCSNHLRPPTLLHSYKGHSTEGYALDFAALTGKLATGDNDGHIHIWDDNYKSATRMYKAQHSVEDIQWSPTEATVLAGGEAGGLVKIYDTRAPNRAMLTKEIGSDTDVNALAWSKLVTNLLATGCDDGKWSVWDLRKLEEPLARFTSHTTPITSMEWHPTDESMLVVSDEVGSFIYDLSVEEEEGAEENGLPPQLLFVHSGSPQTKEVHWHPQITSCLMSTAYDGFHAFIPSNL
jgi:ribosome assembly protein RRB1